LHCGVPGRKYLIAYGIRSFGSKQLFHCPVSRSGFVDLRMIRGPTRIRGLLAPINGPIERADRTEWKNDAAVGRAARFAKARSKRRARAKSSYGDTAVGGALASPGGRRC
jgi:hypothetical protein